MQLIRKNNLRIFLCVIIYRFNIESKWTNKSSKIKYIVLLSLTFIVPWSQLNAFMGEKGILK